MKPLLTPSPLDLPLRRDLAGGELENMKTHLDVLLLALEALTGAGSEAMLNAAQDLGLIGVISDRVALWRLRQANPQRKSSGGRKKLDIEEARSLVLIICYLSQTHQSRIRRGVTLLEQMTEQGKDPTRAALLGDYVDQFTNTFQDRMETDAIPTAAQLMQLAFKLLIDLMFYSATNGHRRLWLALFDQAQS
ncbi:DUF3038 domain-containing protein [Spirulina sp. CCNP1310]|uniref:DUF3038 domain-containing protein n=1 Tax=Spirulina sp. CCNP1310 TaxID=3110249 RepID=UPI002B1FD0A5|nr:DUF3038 domain-containing protein [Spirulina sp. CCNP1310]MEA5418476.1 DUF3038 domain-containing protein [Spirulina sp. CCNP1310]